MYDGNIARVYCDKEVLVGNLPGCQGYENEVCNSIVSYKVTDPEGRFLSYQYAYFCPENVILFPEFDPESEKIVWKLQKKYFENPDRYIVINNFIVDLEEGTIECFGGPLNDGFRCKGNISLIRGENGENNILEIKDDGSNQAVNDMGILAGGTLKIVFDEKNRMREFHDCGFFKEFYLNFLSCGADSLEVFETHVEILNENCLPAAPSLKSFIAPKLVETGSFSLVKVPNLRNIYAPRLGSKPETHITGFRDVPSDAEIVVSPNFSENVVGFTYLRRILKGKQKIRIFEIPKKLMGKLTNLLLNGKGVFKSPVQEEDRKEERHRR